MFDLSPTTSVKNKWQNDNFFMGLASLSLRKGLSLSFKASKQLQIKTTPRTGH